MKLFFIVMLSVMPLIMLGLGRLWITKGAGKVNNIFGYKTQKSTESQEAWDFAHDYLGRIFLKLGMISLFTVPVGVFNSKMFVWMMYLQILFFVVGILPTERALARNFDMEGKPIE